MIRYSLASLLAFALLLPAWLDPVIAQPKVEAAKAERKQAKQAKKAPGTGRLPAYYSQIVTAGQRQRIYQIQGNYNPKIEALQAEIDALEAERDSEIRDVLSPEQQRRLDARIAEAQAKKEAKAEKKAAEKKRNIQPVKKAG